jgi:hypothetical protein
VDICKPDVVYGCDAAWWRFRRGLPEFNGLKICYAGNGLADFPDIRRVKIPHAGVDDLLFDEIGTIGAGGNSGFQALNLAVQFGARKIVLVGFDMTDRSGVHWYGRNRWPMSNNPADHNFKRWIGAFEKAAPVLGQMGVEVVNASPHSALQCFPKKSIAEALHEWL